MRENSKANLAIAIIFILSLCVPAALKVLPGINLTPENNEKRNLAEWPAFSFDNISSYPELVEAYFNDHYGLRNHLISLNSLIRLKAFNASGSPKVLVGKEGWLFYNGDQAKDGSSISNHLGLLPFGYNQIFQNFKNTLESKKEYLESMGIKYIFVIAPDKISIYPEYLPEGYANLDRKTNADLLVEYLKANSNVEVIDLRRILKVQKSTGLQLYYKTDTHWNNIGALLGYFAISKAVSRHLPNVKPQTLNNFTISEMKPVKYRDLSNMLSLKELPDTNFKVTPNKPYTYVHLSEGSEMRDPQLYQNVDPRLPKALFFRDSFATTLIPYLAEDFSSSTYIWEVWKTKNQIEPWLRKQKPDIVIEERVERTLLPSIGLNVF